MDTAAEAEKTAAVAAEATAKTAKANGPPAN